MKWPRILRSLRTTLLWNFSKMSGDASIGSELPLNDLSVPSTVKGMTILDREKFKKDVKIHCYFFENAKASKALKILKPYLIKIPGFHPIQEGHEPCCRVAYLDPIKVPNGFMDFACQEQVSLVEMGFSNETCIRKLTLTYGSFKADEILRAVIPDKLEAVTGYSVIGHIIHLNLRPELEEFKSVIGHVLLDKVPNARTVVKKCDIIENTFRNFDMEVLAGVPEFKTTVKENKCTFSLDFSKVYWNPRLSNEHQKVVSMLKKDDFMFDVFCGVGPFVIPASKKGVRCFANDLNPAAVSWLETNIKTNRVNESLISVWNTDGEKFIREVIKPALLELSSGDYKILIVMNLPALALSFFRCFKGLLTAEEYTQMASISVPVVRIYCFVKCVESENKAEAKQLVENELEMDLDTEVERIDFVRNVAPNKDMMVVQIRLTERILVEKKRPLTDSSCFQDQSCKRQFV